MLRPRRRRGHARIMAPPSTPVDRRRGRPCPGSVHQAGQKVPRTRVPAAGPPRARPASRSAAERGAEEACDEATTGAGWRDRRDDGREQAAPPAAAREWEITVVDRDDVHHYQPGSCSSRSARTRPAESSSRPHAFIPDGVDLVARRDRPGRRPTPRRPRSPTARAAYDYLVIATGTSPRPDQTPGMLGREWRKQRLRLLHLRGRQALATALRALRPRTTRRPHHRDADQVPGRAAGVHLPRRGLACASAACATRSSSST